MMMIILNDDEEDNFYDALHPRQDMIGVPFVTRLTKTNLEAHVMVCFLNSLICLVYHLIDILSIKII